MQLNWADEFDYSGLPDSTKWSYDVGDGCPAVCNWGNQELQYYTKSTMKNARVEHGKLIIEAHREKIKHYNYSSARLVTKNKGDWQYGRIEVKAKLPSGRGTWPAIWMLPTEAAYGGWPQSGEIDIMEHVGHEPQIIYGSVHTKSYHHSIGTQKTAGIYLPDAESNFHIFAIEWSEDKIEFFVDDIPYFSFTDEGTGWKEWPFDRKFHLILNLAVGGTWGGEQGVDDTIWPQRMEVDYVRVYSLK
jgi:beta-glucanase (GH16 family)